MDNKLESLGNLFQLRTKVSSLFAKAEAVKAFGNYRATQPVYQEFITESRIYLQAVLDFNQQFPDELPQETPPIAQPLVNALMVYADIVQSMGDRTTAESLRKEALEVSRIHLDRKGTANLDRSRASTLTMEGRFNEAIVALMSARDLFREEDDQLALAQTTIDLANILQWLGDSRRAKEEIERAEAILRPVLAGKRPSQKDVLDSLISTISNITAGHGNSGAAERTAYLWRAALEVIYYHGLIAKALAEWDEAERCFNQVLSDYQSLGTRESIVYQLAQIKIGRGQFRAALEQMQQIEHVFTEGAFRPKLGVLRKEQAKCLHALNEPREALRLIEESIADLTERHFDPDALWRCHWLKAQIHAAQGGKKLGLEALRSALETIMNLRRAPLGYRLDSTYLTDKKEFYSHAIEATLKAGSPLDCCRFIESIKSRTLSAVLSIPVTDNGENAGLEEQFNEVTQQLDVMEFQGYREGWNQNKLKHREELWKKRVDLLERIRISDPRWRNLSEPIEFKFEEILAGLSERSQAAITLYYEPPNLTAVLLFDGKVTAERLKVSEETANKLADYAKNLQQAAFDYNKHDLSTEYSVLAEHLIPASLLSQALTANSLIVVPHGLLHLVPWGGLLHQDRRLFEYLPVGILPNLNALASVEDSGKPNRVAMVGVSAYPGMKKLGDLPSVRGEIEDINSIYTEADIAVTPPLLDDAATEQAFWNMISSVQGRGNVLHMSCHGTIVPQEPMNSGLLLHDSKIDAAEVARTRLAFDEVVLSACSTGWRPFKVDSRVLDADKKIKVDSLILDADEILGIPAGFLESGVKSVLVSIPKAEEKNARALTTHYHRQRIAGNSPLVAFQSAQKYLLAQGERPGLWIGFTLYGCV
jgi:CHAT domain-containing protein